jgi:copper chaperone CopZ
MLHSKTFSSLFTLSILLITLVGFGCSQQGGNENERAIVKKEIVYSVPAIHCDGCVRSITDALTDLPGIDSVSVQLDSFTAYVRVDTTQSDAATVAKTIDGLGYTSTRQ